MGDAYRPLTELRGPAGDTSNLALGPKTLGKDPTLMVGR